MYLWFKAIQFCVGVPRNFSLNIANVNIHICIAKTNCLGNTNNYDGIIVKYLVFGGYTLPNKYVT
jgi:hypothetical protein